MSVQSVYPSILALSAALAAGVVGGFALMRRISLAGDAVSHIALPGLGIALLVGINPLIGGALTLLIGAVLIWRLETHTGLDTQTVVGVVFSASLALGGLITPNEDLIGALFGGFRGLSTFEFVVALILTGSILLGLWHWKDQFVINLFSSELASATGLNRSRLDLTFSLIFAMTILVGLRFLGALLAGALVVIPPAVARQWTSRLTRFLAISALVSIGSVALGMALASNLHLNQGPAVVAVAAGAFASSLVLRQHFVRVR